MLAVATASCARPPAPPEPPPGASRVARADKPAVLPGALPPSDPPPGTPPPDGRDPASRDPAPNRPPEDTVPMEPAAKPKGSTAVASPATSLGGHDRRLVRRPLDPIAAVDFELGALASPGGIVSGGDIVSGRDGDPALHEALEALSSALAGGSLPLTRFSETAAGIARVRYGDGALHGAYAARLSAPALGRDGTASARLRLFAERSGARSSALGLVILTADGAGAWTVEHFELDTEALAVPGTRPEPWDPYATPVTDL